MRSRGKAGDNFKRLPITNFSQVGAVPKVNVDNGTAQFVMVYPVRMLVCFVQDDFSLLASNVTVFLLPIRYTNKITIIKAAE